MEPLQVGDPEYVGRFRLLGRLGEGGMGRVYLGRTPEGQQAAVKVIRDELAGDTGFRHRFRREVSAAVAVAGMFTARVLDADPDADPPWLATQYVQGPSLKEMVLRHGPLDEPSLRRLAQGLAEALSGIHAAGLVHRDLKPANVLLAADGARVIDFGIAHTSGSTQLTGTGEMIGTPEYMSPEQVSGTGPPGPASDVFAMGSTLCFAATGRSPFAAGQAAAVLYRILESDPQLGGMPPAAADIARACLAKDPARRPTAPQLAAWLRGGTAPAPPPPARATAAQAARPGRRAAIVAGAVVAVAVLGGATALAVANGSAGTSVTVGVTRTPEPSATPVVAMDTPQWRYIDRLCKVGDLLTSLGEANSQTSVTDDPVVIRDEYLAGTARSISVIDAALPDYEILRDDAPTEEARTGFGQVIDEFTLARAAFVEGQDVMEAAEPVPSEAFLTAYQTAIDHFTDGTRNLSLAGTLVDSIPALPPEYSEAGRANPACDPAE